MTSITAQEIAEMAGHQFAAPADAEPRAPDRMPRFRPVSLATLINDGVPAPDMLPGGLLYSGGVHVVSGEPDCGKTTVCLWQALTLLRAGQRVLILDEEGGPEMTAEKLIALGATGEDVAGLTYVPFPASAWGPGDLAELWALVTATDPAMVLIDSVAAFLARAGLDENSAADVTSWWARVLTPIAREHGAAVVAIDHDVKNGTDSRFSRGSGAKLAASDVMIKVKLVQPFSREQNGVLRLDVTKDRRGYLHRAWDVQVRTGEDLSLVLSEAVENPPAGEADLTPAERKLLSVLTTTPASNRDLIDRVAAEYGHGLRRDTVSGCLNRLAAGGFAERLDMGSGRPAFWALPQTTQRDIGGDDA